MAERVQVLFMQRRKRVAWADIVVDPPKPLPVFHRPLQPYPFALPGRPPLNRKLPPLLAWSAWVMQRLRVVRLRPNRRAKAAVPDVLLKPVRKRARVPQPPCVPKQPPLILLPAVRRENTACPRPVTRLLQQRIRKIPQLTLVPLHKHPPPYYLPKVRLADVLRKVCWKQDVAWVFAVLKL